VSFVHFQLEINASISCRSIDTGESKITLKK
jgi:hypothetical protein